MSPPHCAFPLRVLPLPGVIRVEDPRFCRDPSGPHAAGGHLPFLLQPYFWEVKGMTIRPHPAVPGSGRSCRAGGPVGAGCLRPRQRARTAETGREAPPPPSLIFSNDRSRSLGQVGKAAEPPHAPRHAACKTSEREGWKPYRIIQGKASCPAPAQPQRGEGQERGAAVAPRERGRAVVVLGKKTEVESI